jgi:hypothetical protein
LLVIAGWATAILPVNNCRFILFYLICFTKQARPDGPAPYPYLSVGQLYRSEARLEDSLKEFVAWYSGVDRFGFRKNVAYFCGT